MNGKIQIFLEAKVLECTPTVPQSAERGRNSLGISINDSVLLPTDGILDPIDKAVRKYDAHPSICKIRDNI